MFYNRLKFKCEGPLIVSKSIYTAECQEEICFLYVESVGAPYNHYEDMQVFLKMEYHFYILECIQNV
jgi:hypothetical protein